MSPFVTRFAWFCSTWLAVCLPSSADAAETLRVVTTTTDLAAIARAVGGDRVDVAAIATGREDPHFISAKPSYMMAARRADLWIRVGLELEIGYEELILDGSRNPRIRIGTPGHLDASEGVLRREVPTQRIDRSMGDIHPQGNPHYWLDPLNGRIVARSIGERLAKLAPEHADYFQERTRAFQQELDERMFGPDLVREFGGSKLWALLLKGRFDDVLRGRSDGEPGGWLDVKVLLMEPFYERKAPDLVASQTGLKVIVCANSVGGQPGTVDYLSMLDNVVSRVSTAFRAGE